MRDRCLNPSTPGYERYGGRGITICERWRNDFAAFLADMGPRPTGVSKNGRATYTIERIDNDGPYAPGNCRWVTYTVQARNRRTNRPVEWEGERMLVQEMAGRVGLDYHALRHQIHKYGRTPEEAVRRLLARQDKQRAVPGGNHPPVGPG
jgi:hypothetical protein